MLARRWFVSGAQPALALQVDLHLDAVRLGLGRDLAQFERSRSRRPRAPDAARPAGTRTPSVGTPRKLIGNRSKSPSTMATSSSFGPRSCSRSSAQQRRDVGLRQHDQREERDRGVELAQVAQVPQVPAQVAAPGRLGPASSSITDDSSVPTTSMPASSSCFAVGSPLPQPRSSTLAGSAELLDQPRALGELRVTLDEGLVVPLADLVEGSLLFGSHGGQHAVRRRSSSTADRVALAGAVQLGRRGTGLDRARSDPQWSRRAVGARYAGASARELQFAECKLAEIPDGVPISWTPV